MIVRKTLPLSRLLHFVANRILLFFLFDIGVAVAFVVYGVKWLSIPEIPLSLVGAALTVFLAFRIKAAYDRWWEARILWGGLVNWSRTLARRTQILTSSATGAEEQGQIRAFHQRMTYWQIAYVHALRSFLRGHNSVPELSAWLSPEDLSYLKTQNNVPAAMLLEMGRMAQHAYQQGWMDEFRLIAIEEALGEITSIQGGCERIKNTPVPRQFDYFPRLFINAYCLMLPIGLVADLKLLTPVASSLIAFMLVSLESFGSHIENPFENSINDVPMTALARTIEINLKQGLNERQVPAPLQPVEGFLF